MWETRYETKVVKLKEFLLKFEEVANDGVRPQAFRRLDMCVFY